jgi:hypothetical protein
MKTYFQVCAGFALSGCKPSLVSLSLHSVNIYFPFLVGSVSSYLSHSRYFHSIPQAQDYINYLFKRYPNTTVPANKTHGEAVYIQLNQHGVAPVNFSSLANGGEPLGEPARAYPVLDSKQFFLF